MYTSVQAAVAAATAAGGSNRAYIQIAPGTYTEQVCVKAGSPPITLYSTNADASQTVIQFADFQGGVGTLGQNPCGGDTNQQASTLDAFNAGFQAKNLTIQNDVTNAQLGSSTATQATALATTGDQVVLDNVRVLSHQDTLYIDAPAGTVARVYVKNSYIAGDVDFIFGASTAVFDGCTIEFVSDRHPSGGQPLAPDTDDRNAYGFLVINSKVTADASTASGVAALGRAWDHSCTDVPTYVNSCVASGKYPNGQATVMNTTIDGHFSQTTPWVAAATTKRGYSSTAWACTTGGTCPANRFYEYDNTGAGSAAGM
jgi:pectinesterase